MPLTDAKIKGAKPKVYTFTDGDGLYLDVNPSDRKC